MKNIDKCLKVDLDERSYQIFVDSGILSDKLFLKEIVGNGQAMIVTNSTIAKIYLDSLLKTFPNANHISIPDGEQFKNLDTVQIIFDELMHKRHNRSTTLLALGGGVVGDITGFASACFQRGVNFIQIPTTLLAQVDSSVGGKTGVNHALGKNMIGAFHQPRAVLVDIDTLNTLPDREFIAGLAEVIKYGLISDYDFFEWIEKNISALLNRDEDSLRYAILTSCKNKAKIVSKDEHEQGLRAILNLGHTFAHAIETITEYKVWLHGEAVGFGMILALDLSRSLGLIDADDFDRVKQLISAANLPTTAPSSLNDVNTIVDLMGMDKKVINGKLRFILLNSIGHAFIHDSVPLDKLKQVLSRHLNNS